MKRHIHLCRGRQSGAKDQVGSQPICIGPAIKDSDHILGHEDRSCKHFRLFISLPLERQHGTDEIIPIVDLIGKSKHQSLVDGHKHPNLDNPNRIIYFR